MLRLLCGLLAGLVLLVGLLLTTIVGVVSSPATFVGVLLAGRPVVSEVPPALVGGVPVDTWSLIQAAAQSSRCGVPAEVLGAIAKIETGGSYDPTVTSPSGYKGLGQFDATTWAAYGAGGNPYNPKDALAAIARVLCARGYSDTPARALNSFGGCTSPNCIVHSAILPMYIGDYAGLVDALASGLRVGNDVVALVRPYVGKTPYVFGGVTPAGWDCSGMVLWAEAQVGVKMPRTAADQYAATARLDREQLQPGDLVFFSNTYMAGLSHVGIYEGGGLMINASDEKTGTVEVPVWIGYWGAHYTGAGRVKR